MEKVIGVLPYQEIKKLINAVDDTFNAIQNATADNIESASYDLRLGKKYFIYDSYKDTNSEIPVQEFLEIPSTSSRITIPPNGAMFIEMAETLNLPDDIVGHLTLKLDLLLQGVIIAAQSQIDAGYKGPIFGLLYNLSNKRVNITHLSSVFRLELVRMQEPSHNPKTGDFRYRSLSDETNILDINSSLSHLKKELEEGKSVIEQKIVSHEQKLEKYSKYGIITLLFTILLGLFPIWFNSFANMSDIKGNMKALTQTSSSNGEDIHKLKDDLITFKKESRGNLFLSKELMEQRIETLEKKLEALEKQSK